MALVQSNSTTAHQCFGSDVSGSLSRVFTFLRGGSFLVNYSLAFTCTLVLYLSAFMPEKFAYLCNINQAPNFAILNFQQRRAKLYFLACCHSSESSLLTCKLIGLKIQDFCFIEEKDLEDTCSCIPWFIPANSDSHMHCPQYS